MGAYDYLADPNTPEPAIGGVAQKTAPDMGLTDANPYDAVATEMANEERAKVDRALQFAGRVDPERYIDAQRVAFGVGVPIEQALNDNDGELARAQRVAETRKILEGNPKLAEWFADKDNGNVVKFDELKKLDGLSWLTAAGGAAWKEGMQDVRLNSLRWAQMNGEATPEMIAEANKLNADQLAEGRRTFGADGLLDEAFTLAAQQLPNMLYTFTEAIKGGLAGATAGAAIGSVVGDDVGAITGAALGAPVGAIYKSFMAGASLEGGAAYNEMLNLKNSDGTGIDPTVAGRAALVVGTVNGILEVVGLKYSVGLIPGADRLFRSAIREGVSEATKNRTVQRALLGFGTNVAKSVVAEAGVTEPLQELTAAVAVEVAKSVGGKDMERASLGDIAGRVRDVMVDTAKAQIILGPLFATPRFARDLQQARRASRVEQQFRDIIENAKDNSALIDRDKNRAKEAVDKLTENGAGIDRIYIPAEQARELFQSRPELEQEIPGFNARLAESVATGGDFEMSTSEFYAHIARTELAEAILPNMRLSPAGYTLSEAQKFNEGIREAQQKAFDADLAALRSEEEKAAPAAKVFAAVREMSIAAGNSPDVANQHGRLFEIFFGTLADRIGDDPLSLFQSYGVKIRREIPDDVPYQKRTEFDLVLDAIRAGKSGQAELAVQRAKGPTLGEWLKRRGGIVGDETASELTSAGMQQYIARVDPKTGRVVSGRARRERLQALANYQIDGTIQAAKEEGFFDDLGDAEIGINEFMDALSRDTYSPRLATEPQSFLASIAQTTDMLAELGIDINADNETIRAQIAAAAAGQPQEGDLFQFAGRFAIGVDNAKLNEARAMDLRGELAGDIFDQTGFFKGADGQWRFEIADNEAKFRDDITQFGGWEWVGTADDDRRLADVLDHPKLFAAYPSLADITIAKDNGMQLGRANGAYSPDQKHILISDKLTNDKAMSTLLHEVAHAIQQIEGFAPGGNTSMGELYEGERVSYHKARLKELDAQWTDANARLEAAPMPDITDPIQYRKDVTARGDIYKEIDAIETRMRIEHAQMVQAAKYEFYRRLAGEVEARNVQSRADFDEQQRRDIPPNYSQDVPYNQQKVLIARATNAGDAFNAAADPIGVGTDAFEAWFGDSKVVDKDGKPLRVYHGTASVFDAFDRARAGIESDSGAGFYFSNNPEEVAANYATEVGPDISGRIERLAEQIEQDDEFEGTTDDALRLARERLLVEHSGATVPVYLSIQNPVVIGGKGETFLDYVAEYDEETEEFTGEESGKLVDFVMALRSIAEGGDFFDIDIDGAVGTIMEAAEGEGLTASKLIELLQNNPRTGGDLIYAMDENGNLAGNEIIRQAFEAIGFDGYIDRTVNKKFGSEKRVGKQMAGMNPDTAHYIAFRPEQIKSVFNRGAFDPADPRILFQKKEVRQGNEKPRGSIRLSPGQTVISLFATADLSTFLHESGHFFLEVLKDVATRSNAPAGVVADWNTVRAELGIGDDGVIPTEAHEKFARGFERYLFDGEAPSEAARGLFARFRTWLMFVYRTAKNLNAEVSPALRGVFDRMLATDDEIAAARGNPEFKPAFESAEAAGMTPEAFAEYQRLANDSVEAARADFMGRLLGEVKRETSRAWREAKARIRAEVIRELAASPVYQATAFMRDGTMPDGSKAERLQMNRDDVIAVYGEGILPRLPKYVPPIVSRSEGVHPDVIAGMFGFASGHAMLTELISAPPLATATRDRVNERMRADFGDLLSNQDAAAAQAVEAMHNDKRGQFVDVELSALNKKAGINGQPSARQFAARAAREMIGSKKIPEATRVGTYQATEAKAARAAERAILDERWAEASEFKRRQLFNHYLALEARRARDEVDAAVRYLSQFTGTKRSATIDPDYLDQIEAMLERFDMRRSVSQADVARRKSMAQFIAEQEAAGNSVDMIPEPLRNDAFRQSYKDLTVDELRGLRDAVKNIEHLGRLKNKILVKRREAEFGAARDEIVAGINKRPALRKRSSNRNPTAKEKAYETLGGLQASLIKVEQLVAELDGGDVNGPMNRLIFEPISAAQSRENELNADVSRRIDEILGRFAPGYLQERVTIAGLPGDNTFTRGEMLVVALNMGTQSNLDKMLKGEGWTAANLQSIVGNLQEADWKAVQDILDVVNSLWPEIAAVERRMSGTVPPKVEAREIETPFGTLPGGYFPMSYDPRRAFDVEQRAGAALFEEGNTFRTPTTEKGFTKARVEGYARPIRFDLAVLPEHMAKVIHYVTHREVVRDVNKLLTDNAVQQALETRVGRTIRGLFRDWLADIANGDKRPDTTEAWQRWALASRANMSIFALGFSFTTASAQIVGLTASQAYLRGRWLAVGLKQFVANPFAARDFVYARSGEMKHRQSSMETDVRRAILKHTDRRKGVVGTARFQAENARRFAFYGIAFMDNVVSIPTWLGGYHKHLSENVGDEMGARAAGDRAVRLTQGSGYKKDLARVQRNDVANLLNPFYSPFSALYNQLRDVNQEVREADNNVDRAYALARLWWMIVVPAILGELLTAKLPGDDDDDETVYGWAARKVALYPLQAVPVIRSFAGALDNGFTVQLDPLSRLLETGNRLAKAVKNYDKDDAPRKIIRHTIDLVGLGVGLPVRPVNIAINNTWRALADGNVAWRDLIKMRPENDKDRR